MEAWRGGRGGGWRAWRSAGSGRGDRRIAGVAVGGWPAGVRGGPWRAGGWGR